MGKGREGVKRGTEWGGGREWEERGVVRGFLRVLIIYGKT